MRIVRQAQDDSALHSDDFEPFGDLGLHADERGMRLAVLARCLPAEERGTRATIRAIPKTRTCSGCNVALASSENAEALTLDWWTQVTSRGVV